MSRPDWIRSHPEGPLLDGLLAVAWADGAVSEEERQMLAALVGALGVEVSEHDLDAWCRTRPDADEVAAQVEDPLARRFLLDRAFVLAAADGEFAASEEALVARWASGWGIGADELAELRAEALAR